MCVCKGVLHGSRNGKIPRDDCGIIAEAVMMTIYGRAGILEMPGMGLTTALMPQDWKHSLLLSYHIAVASTTCYSVGYSYKENIFIIVNDTSLIKASGAKNNIRLKRKWQKHAIAPVAMGQQ